MSDGKKWGFLGRASRRMRHAVMEKDKEKDTSVEFKKCNKDLKDTRKFLAGLRAECELFQAAGQDFFAAFRRFQSGLVALSQNKDYAEVLGEPFVHAFSKSQTDLVKLLEALTQNLVSSFTRPIETEFAAEVAEAKEKKLVMYDNLHKRNALASKISTLGQSKKLANSAKLLELRQEHLKAAAQFARSQQETVYAMGDVEEHIDLTIMQLLCDVAAQHNDAYTRAVALTAPSAEMAETAMDAVNEQQEVWERSVERRSREALQVERTLGLMGSDTDVDGATMLAACMTEEDNPSIIPPPLPGEDVVATIGGIRNQATAQFGLVLLSNYRLRFVPYRRRTARSRSGSVVAIEGGEGVVSEEEFADLDLVQPLGRESEAVLSVPHMSLSRVETAGSGTKNVLLLYCTNMRLVALHFGWCPMPDVTALMVQETMAEFVWQSPSPSVPSFPFQHTFTPPDGAPPPVNGWQLYDVDAELNRMITPVGRYRVSEANAHHELAPTYPSRFVTLYRITDSDLVSAARFRSKARLPAIVWAHKDVSLSRASQPLSGILNARSDRDELLVTSLIPDTVATRGKKHGLVICDARPKLNAITNKGKGGGTEKMTGYARCRLEHLGIDNIHVVREALVHLRSIVLDACSRSLHSHTKETADSTPATRSHLRQHPRSTDSRSTNGGDDTDHRLHRAASAGATLSSAAPGAGAGAAGAGAGAGAGVGAGAAAGGGGGVDGSMVSPLPPSSAAMAGGALGRHSPSGSSADSDSVPGVDALATPVRPDRMPPSAAGLTPPALASGTATFGPDAPPPPSRPVPPPPPPFHRMLLSLPPPPQHHPPPPSRHVAIMLSSPSVPRPPTQQPPSVASDKTVLPQVTGHNSDWLKLISTVLAGGLRVAHLLASDMSVLVHCSDGWDRTAQLTCLAQLLLDPYYRTLRGFATLIEKEWCRFGHQFARRSGTGNNRNHHQDTQRSPIFLQWVDCVFQLWCQQPTVFEFNERLLEALTVHVYSSRFGTFLYDCDRQRVAADVEQTTVSFWTVVFAHRNLFVNPGYEPVGPAVDGESWADGRVPSMDKQRIDRFLISPVVDPAAMRVWRLYVRMWETTL